MASISSWQSDDGGAAASPDHAALRQEGLGWLARLNSGVATREDLDGLERWRSRSRAHDEAFEEACHVWRAVAPALERQSMPVPVRPGMPSLSRRAALGGAFAASAAGVFVLHSTTAVAADFSTGKGERRRVALGDGMAIDLNTNTRIDVDRAKDAVIIRLLGGEVFATADGGAARRIEIGAGKGRAFTQNARFAVRATGGNVQVTCAQGSVSVDDGAKVLDLYAREQISYSDAGFGRLGQVDPAAVTAWRAGRLVFNDLPLDAAIAEVNRYSKGRILLVNSALASRRVSGVFPTNRTKEILDQLQYLFGARISHVPGGVTIVS